MTRLCILKVLKGHIQLLAKIQQPAKCIDKGENVAWKVAIRQVCPLHNQKVRKSNDDDQSSSHRPSDFMEGIYFKKYQWGPKIRNSTSVSKMAAVRRSKCWIFVIFSPNELWILQI